MILLLILSFALSKRRPHAADLIRDPAQVEGLLQALGQTGGRTADGWAEHAVEPGDVEAVTLTTIDRIHERRWPFVILGGCVDGRFPDTDVRIPYFDPLLVESAAAGGGLVGTNASDGGDGLVETAGPGVATTVRASVGDSIGHAGEQAGVPSLSDRARLQAIDERRRFRRVLGASITELVAIAAPAAGELVSRFVEGWEVSHPPRLGEARAKVAALATTTNDTPVHPSASLRLSATQLDTYANCGWNYAIQYGLGVRGADNVSSRFGTLVHAILERFLSEFEPSGLGRRSRARLQAISEELWDDDLFEYRPQATDYRRRLDALLDDWYDREGHRAVAMRTEYRFEFQSGDHRVTGSIDRIDAHEDHSLEIIDYKTGTKPSKAVLAGNLQLPLYHLAALRDPALIALGRPSRLRFAYLTSGDDVWLPIDDELPERTEARIATSAAEIVAENFTPSVLADCQYCDLKRICPLQTEGREVPR